MVLHFSLTCFVNSQDPNAIEHQEGPSGDLYAMPLKSGKKGKKEKKKGKGREEEAEQQEELTEEEKAAMYSVPDKKAQKAKSQGVSVCYFGPPL